MHQWAYIISKILLFMQSIVLLTYFPFYVCQIAVSNGEIGNIIGMG
jgi:hypothetical protein